MYDDRSSGGAAEGQLATRVSTLGHAVTDLLEVDLADVGDPALLDLLAALEQQASRLAAASQRVVAAVEERRLGRGLGYRDTASLLRGRLRIPIGEARSRTALAAAALSLAQATGEPTASPLVAAQGEGLLSVAHARVIRSVLDELPATLREEHAASVERELVELAGRLDPDALRRRGRRLLARLDADLVRQQDVEHERRRSGRLVRNADGSGDLSLHLTPVGLAFVEAVLWPLAAPAPSVDGAPDPRTPAMRMHDAVVELCRRAAVAKDVPGEGGAPVTVLVTVPLEVLTGGSDDDESEDDGARGPSGQVRTQYGGTMSVHDLLWLAGEAEVVPVVVDQRGSPLAVGRARRFATRAQHLALVARDRGCTFPGCDHPAAWTQRHHVVPWAKGGRTDLDNLALLCVFHHAHFEVLGWECVMVGGLPHWRPPTSVDPEQRLLRNNAHDLDDDIGLAA